MAGIEVTHSDRKIDTFLDGGTSEYVSGDAFMEIVTAHSYEVSDSGALTILRKTLTRKVKAPSWDFGAKELAGYESPWEPVGTEEVATYLAPQWQNVRMI